MCALCGDRTVIELGTGLVCVICDNRPTGSATWFSQWLESSGKLVDGESENDTGIGDSGGHPRP